MKRFAGILFSLFLFYPCAYGKSPCGALSGRTHCVNYSGLMNEVFGPLASGAKDFGLLRKDSIVPGHYYQKATGKSCSEARMNAENKFLFNYPEFQCHHNKFDIRVPRSKCAEWPCIRLYSGKCERNGNSFTAWLEVDASKPPSRKSKPPKPGNIILLQRLQKGKATDIWYHEKGN